MRKVVLSNMVSLDGFFAGPNGEIDWHHVDADFIAYAENMLKAADTLLFGRITYQLMAGYWPAEKAIADDPVIAGKMNGLEKVVFSHTLEEVNWNNSTLAKQDLITTVTGLKQQAGGNILILGSGSLVSPLADAGLIDEYQIIVNPIILGQGKSHLQDVSSRISLQLVKAVPLSSGNVVLYYRR